MRNLISPGFRLARSVQHLKADDGFTIFIKFQCISSSIDKVDNRALLEGLTVVDLDNHTFIGVFSRRFDLCSQRQLEVGRSEGCGGESTWASIPLRGGESPLGLDPLVAAAFAARPTNPPW